MLSQCRTEIFLYAKSYFFYCGVSDCLFVTHKCYDFRRKTFLFYYRETLMTDLSAVMMLTEFYRIEELETFCEIINEKAPISCVCYINMNMKYRTSEVFYYFIFIYYLFI